MRLKFWSRESQAWGISGKIAGSLPKKELRKSNFLYGARKRPKTLVFGHSLRGLACLFFLGACGLRTDQIALDPPLTHPLSLSFIGYGVVNASYTLLMDGPESNGVSLGYARRGSVVTIIERRFVNDRGSTESWVIVEGTENIEGWIKEKALDIYDNEYKAQTASELMNR
jgi:hypothetical protein